MLKLRVFTLLLLLGLILSGCQTLGKRQETQGQVTIEHPEEGLAEERLLDVWIELFEPGPELTKEDLARGVTPGIRKAESRFIPVHLKKTLQQAGYWGAVRVVPKDTEGAELLVSGQILQSDGEILNLQIRARDSTNRLWLEKEYTALGESGEYEGISEGKYDTFQDLYNAIANDLAVLKQAMPREDLVRIRQIAELRFGRELVPEAFDGYLVRDGETYRLRRLPARDDPMLKRIRSIRERDYLFIDTLNDHYDGFYRDTWQPYSDWRQFRTEEAEDLRQIEREAMTRKLVGIGAVVGAIALSMVAGTDVQASTDGLRQLMLLGGLMVAKSGFDKDGEKQIHIDAMEELGTSFEAEVSPMVVEVDGEVHRLNGSVEGQYAGWRDLLQRIHRSETSLPDLSK